MENSGIATILPDLRALLGSRITTSASEREHHSHGESYHRSPPPDAVCYPESTEDVVAIVKLCARHRVPLIPFGAGSSLEGHVDAVRGGISMDMRLMNKILAVNADDLDATVQAGVTRKTLNAHLRDKGLFFSVDPGADASVGGMAATRASGTTAVRYGTMRENVVSMTVVTPDGEVVRTARRARKSAAGYNLTNLFVGSEGTLGVIVEVTVRLHGIPEAVGAAVCPFPTIEAAIRTVVDTIQMGIPIAKVEYIDEQTIQLVNETGGTRYAVTPTLFLEFSGSAAQVAEQTASVRAIAEENGALSWQDARDADERAKLWHARAMFHLAGKAKIPNGSMMGLDVCVPISRLPECVHRAHAITRGMPFIVTMLGHVGDGNLHLGVILDPTDAEHMRLARQLNEEIVSVAIDLDGTCTGEHGIGTGKIKYMRREHGNAIGVMQKIKAALDPLGIMNPGKVLPKD